MRNKRFPNYPDDTDYTTNAPSYYDDLARKQKLIELLAKKIWEYEETLDLTLEEISNRLESYINENDNLMTERLEQWDLNLEKFPENVELLLQEWLSDGTLDHIINETIFNWKLDTSIFEQFRDSTTAQLQQIAKVIQVDGIDGTLAIQTAINDGYTNLVIPTCEIDSLQLLDNKNYRFVLNDDIKHKNNATGDMFKSGTGTSIYFIGQGHTIDGNFTNQSNPLNLFNVTGTKNIIISNTKMMNIKARAIRGTDSTIELFKIETCEFLNADTHTGTIGEGTGFIAIFGGRLNIINDCSFIQTNDPAFNENRNPGGIIFSGNNPQKKIVVTNCYFENLGHNVAGNLESPLDTYSYAKQVIYKNNTFIKSRFIPYRVTNAEMVDISNNHVYQNVPITNDGGTPYPDASCLSVAIVVRYPGDENDNDLYNIENNVHEIGSNINARALTVVGSNLYKLRKVNISKNIFLSETGNTSPGVLISTVKDTVIDDLDIQGFNHDIVVQNTAELDNPIITIKNTSFKGNLGVFARLNVANLTIVIKQSDFSKTKTSAFSIRNVYVVDISGCLFPVSNSGEMNQNSILYFYNNILQYPAEPSGYNTSTYYRLYNNHDRKDLTSEPEPEKEPIRSTSLTNMATLVPLYIGELFMDSNNNDFWLGYALTEGSWKKITGV